MRSIGVAFNQKDTVDMITFDLQQILPTPNLHHKDNFYLCHLSTYNFGVHDCVSNKGYMFLWDETRAKRGSSEIASCLDMYFTKFSPGARLVHCLLSSMCNHMYTRLSRIKDQFENIKGKQDSLWKPLNHYGLCHAIQYLF